MEWFNKEDNLFSYQSSGMRSDDGQKSTDDVGEAVDFHVITPMEWDERIKNTFHINGNNPDFADEHGVLLLFHAINFGTSDVVRFLLEAGADANYVSWQGHSPWFLAVDSKNMAKIHLLEKIHADQTIQNNSGHNALHLIAMRGDIRLFHYLIHHAPLKAVLAVNRWGNSLLHLTASRHRHLLMRICLTHAEIPIDLENHE
ncbi:MAG: ankyrin repeat domain-containing protein [Alphaproteobacteria bacterium]|nr:ankyrin repeat domain-containing protein [Alphaproteobacteria bacterium]